MTLSAQITRDQEHIAGTSYNSLKSSAPEVSADDNWLAKRQADLESRALSEGLNKHELLELRSTDGGASGATYRIFYRLLFVHRNEATGACFPSAKALAQGTGTQERTVRTQIGILSKLGWITIRKRKSNKSGQWVNSYEFPGLAESGSSDRKAGPRLVISNDEKLCSFLHISSRKICSFLHTSPWKVCSLRPKGMQETTCQGMQLPAP